MDRWLSDIRLRGRHAILAPLSQDHAADLAECSADGDLYRLWYTSIPAPEAVPAEIGRRLALQREGRMLAFAVLEAGSGRAVGMTTFMNVDAANKRLEIGHTWYARRAQRTGVNTECKLMLLTHAFETLGCIAVEFRTHRLNTRSRRAIERLGAQLDGVLRAHMVLPNGSIRDTAVYSVIAPEWPAVKAGLSWRLAQAGGKG